MTRRRPHSAGFSLVEVLIVLTITAVVLGSVVVSFRSLRRATAKSAAGQLAAAIRYTYDRAITTGGYYRMVFDLDPDGKEGARYWVEKSDNRFYLARDKEKGDGRGRAPDEEEEEKKRKEKEERQKPLGLTQDAALEPPPEPRRAKFESFQDSNLPKVQLRGVKVKSIFTRRQREPYTEGKAYLYFFPDGHTERAIIHVADDDDDVYSLIVQPLTGRVELKAGEIEAARDFDVDAEGRSEAPR